VISNPVGTFGTYQRVGALILVTLATVVYGCGGSGDVESVVPPTSSVKLKAEDFYRYEGEGANKKKSHSGSEGKTQAAL